jgi:Asp-tRNA(Asn)/Glu-tRNA(Gln) amidotransferase B subunit
MICLEDEVRRIIKANPEKVEQTRQRPKELIGWFVGQAMKATNAAFDEGSVRLVVYEEIFTR